MMLAAESIPETEEASVVASDDATVEAPSDNE